MSSTNRFALPCALFLVAVCLLALLRPNTASLQAQEVPVSEWENLRIDHEMDWDAGTIQVRSFSSGPGHGRLVLLNSSGKRRDQVETRRIEGGRFLERTKRPPIVEIRTEGHGTGLKYRDLLWYSVDRGKFDLVLELTDWQNCFIPGGRQTAQGNSRIEHEDASLQIVNDRKHGDLFRYPEWPSVRIRTRHGAWYENKAGNVVKDAGARIAVEQREFDPKKRAYRSVSTKILSDTLRSD